MQLSNMLPVGDLTFVTKDKRSFVYQPQQDITTIELAHILHLMILAVNSRVGITWEPFVEKHKLWRHLKEKTPCS